MDTLRFPSRPSLFLTIVLSAALLHSTLSQDSTCTNDRSGFPACDFNNPNMCNWIEVGKDSEDFSWLSTAADDVDGPFESGYENDYIFLDPVKSNEQPVKLEAGISAGKAAVCVLYYYATSGPNEDPIRFYLYDSTEYLLMHEFYPNTDDLDIYTTWQSTEFECCLPNVESDKRAIALEATSHPDAIVAMDYIDIRVSEMVCEGDELVCYPPLPTAPPTPARTTAALTEKLPQTTTTVGDSEDLSCPGEELGAASCDFGANGDSEDFCGWSVDMAVWEIVVDGSGEESYLIDTTGGSQSIESDLSTEIESVCMEVQFSTENPVDSLAELFSVYLSDGTSSELWWVSYDYSGSEADVWKTNSFSGCLGTGPSGKIKLTSHHKGLMINHIYMRTADLGDSCDEDTGTSPVDSLSCSVTEIPAESFCGFTVFPEASETTNTVVWEETTDTGSYYYMSVSGTRGDLNETVPTLTSKNVLMTKDSILSFSYSITGGAVVRVTFYDLDRMTEEVVFTTEEDTSGEHVPTSVQLGVTGQYQVIFQVSSNTDGNVDEEAVVSFGDIFLVEIDGPNVPATTEEPEENVRSEDQGVHVGAVLAGVIVSVVVLILIGVFVWIYKKRRAGPPLVGRYNYSVEIEEGADNDAASGGAKGVGVGGTSNGKANHAGFENDAFSSTNAVHNAAYDPDDV